MAKDLPYFKFFCSEWNDGDITLEDYEIQGLFINICSYYWSSGCEVSLQKVKKRFRNQDKNINYLLKTEIIKRKDKNISINFLDEQWTERQTKSSKNSAAAKARWDKQTQSKRNANASEMQCESNAIKIREEKKRKDKIREELFNSQVWKEGISKLNKCKLIEVEKYLVIFLEGQELDDNLDRDLQEIRKHFRAWFSKQDFKSDKPKRTIAL
jgi:hypothetical protein